MLVFAAIAPHGTDVIPQLADDLSVMQATRDAMRELGRRFADTKPDTVVIATPHGIIFDGLITVSDTKEAAGILSLPDGRYVKTFFEIDTDFVGRLKSVLESQEIPYHPLIGKERKEEAIMPLDWGAVVPLWFTAHPMRPRPKIVVLGPDRKLPRETLVQCGEAIARVAEESGRRVAFIASCDLGHAHDPDGRYGYDPASEQHDDAYCEAIVTDDLPRLLAWDEDFLEAAKVDAYWQTLILIGALEHTPMHAELLSYEAPTYFGMAVAAYTPDRRDAEAGQEAGGGQPRNE